MTYNVFSGMFSAQSINVESV